MDWSDIQIRIQRVRGECDFRRVSNKRAIYLSRILNYRFQALNSIPRYSLYFLYIAQHLKMHVGKKYETDEMRWFPTKIEINWRCAKSKF